LFIFSVTSAKELVRCRDWPRYFFKLLKEFDDQFLLQNYPPKISFSSFCFSFPKFRFADQLIEAIGLPVEAGTSLSVSIRRRTGFSLAPAVWRPVQKMLALSIII
jgi:hypothetical protein